MPHALRAVRAERKQGIFCADNRGGRESGSKLRLFPTNWRRSASRPMERELVMLWGIRSPTAFGRHGVVNNVRDLRVSGGTLDFQGRAAVLGAR